MNNIPTQYDVVPLAPQHDSLKNNWGTGFPDYLSILSNSERSVFYKKNPISPYDTNATGSNKEAFIRFVKQIAGFNNEANMEVHLRRFDANQNGTKQEPHLTVEPDSNAKILDHTQ